MWKDSEAKGGKAVFGTNLDYLKRKAFVENPVYFSAPRELQRIDLVPRAFDSLLEVHGELLNHPVIVGEK